MKYKILIYFWLLGCCLIVLTGCTKTEPDYINDKITDSIIEFDSRLTKICVNYLNGYYNKDKELDWNEILKDVEYAIENIDIIVLDINEIEYDNADLIKLKEKIYKLILAIDEENINDLIINIVSVDYELSNILKNKLNKEIEGELLNFKSDLLLSYIYVINDENEKGNEILKSIDIKYNSLLNNENYKKEYFYNYNRVFYYYNEYINSIDLGEKSLIKINMYNLLEEI